MWKRVQGHNVGDVLWFNWPIRSLNLDHKNSSIIYLFIYFFAQIIYDMSLKEHIWTTRFHVIIVERIPIETVSDQLIMKKYGC